MRVGLSYISHPNVDKLIKVLPHNLESISGILQRRLAITIQFQIEKSKWLAGFDQSGNFHIIAKR